MTSPAAPLYRRLLAHDFDRLPEGLRRFHDAPEGGRASGHMKITAGPTFVHRFVAWLARFPPPADRIDLSLRVRIEGDRERWIRDFGEKRLESLQWKEGDLFAEAAGPMTLLFRLEHDDEGVLAFRFVRARMLGLPLPSFLSPRAEVSVRPDRDPGGWQVDVRLSVPLLGEILRYEGTVRAAG